MNSNTSGNYYENIKKFLLQMLKQINNHLLHGGNKRKLDDYTKEQIDRKIKKKKIPTN